jgi:hypothetical protein
MRAKYQSAARTAATTGTRLTAIILALTLVLIFALAVTVGATLAANTQTPAVAPAPVSSPADNPAAAPNVPPAMTILNSHDVEGILGREVLSAANENMGRVVDVIVDRAGRVRAAIIDFGGFLGVGSRKIAVDWNALEFPPPGQSDAKITLELTRDQVNAAPEYQDGKPVVVLGALGKLEPLQFE